MRKKIFVKRSFSKIVSHTKIVGGKKVTETKREEWSEDPTESKINAKSFDKFFDHLTKSLDTVEKALDADNCT